MKFASSNHILGLWRGISIADDLFEFELSLRRSLVFEILDIENEELIMGEYSIEYAHGIYYLILKSSTEVFVFQWDGKRELKSNSLLFHRSEMHESLLHY